MVEGCCICGFIPTFVRLTRIEHSPLLGTSLLFEIFKNILLIKIAKHQEISRSSGGSGLTLIGHALITLPVWLKLELARVQSLEGGLL